MIWKSGWFSKKDNIHLLLDGEENSHIKMLCKIYKYDVNHVLENHDKTDQIMKMAFDNGLIRFGYIKYDRINDIGQLYIEGSKKFINNKDIYNIIGKIEDILYKEYKIEDIQIIDYSNERDNDGYQNYERIELKKELKI